MSDSDPVWRSIALTAPDEGSLRLASALLGGQDGPRSSNMLWHPALLADRMARGKLACFLRPLQALSFENIHQVFTTTVLFDFSIAQQRLTPPNRLQRQVKSFNVDLYEELAAVIKPEARFLRPPETTRDITRTASVGTQHLLPQKSSWSPRYLDPTTGHPECPS